MEGGGKKLVAALAGALACALLAISFLLGRLSATGEEALRLVATKGVVEPSPR